MCYVSHPGELVFATQGFYPLERKALHCFQLSRLAGSVAVIVLLDGLQLWQ